MGTIIDLFKSRRLIYELSKKDLQVRYLGSYLGILWAFIQPIVTILIFWFIFQVGFKFTPVDNFPFILWFVPAFLSWNFFADCLQSATNSVIENSYLVKKVVFRVSILPIIKINSALLVHCFFIVFLLGMFVYYGYDLSLYNLQVFYYLFATVILVLGLSFITSSLVIFLKDVGQFISMILQFGFWITPIFWTLETVPDKFHSLIRLNPMYYIVEGYRDSFVYNQWFWEKPDLAIYFWTVSVFLFILGLVIFKRLRPHFADVL
ncbi:ABC transporter permease [Ammoniphilus resinae]|uniref:Transport permease protein n=1 Tax=Ammoniphilus resinae TaxID=861532 RepID=A0ABS4GXK5_9BACL|nr:ABC transporter permease [Ammoniphilus resinae]MBP1934762.1 lipopolysaccharide transport system permease protein/teichoic acid transport system permease protein [Ammoniphilus resinae]